VTTISASPTGEVKVAVFGAGALGSVYGVRLATRARVDVSWVVRPTKVDVADPIVIEKIRGDERESIHAPERVAAVPGDADVVLLAVGTEDLEAIRGPLRESDAPIVILTPMMPRDWQRVRSAFGARALAAMPNVVAYARKDDGVFRYWLPPAPTRIDEPRAGDPHADAVRELAERLDEAGLNAHLELGVHERNPATTVAWIPIAMAFAVAGSADALVKDDSLLSLTTRACREGTSLGRRIGAVEPFALASPLIAAPWALRTGLAALARMSPEAIFYAEEHFGRKLAAQHRVMIREMIDLAKEKRVGHAAFEELAARLQVGLPPPHSLRE
jgi:ketopantoate reductase